MNNPKVFITGASGFVGANLINAFVKKGYKVHALLRANKNIWRLKDNLSNISVHSGDILNFNSLKKTIHKIQPDYIAHLATNGAYSTQSDINKILETNIIGTKNLLLASKDIPYKCFINTGSSSEYGIKNKPMKETDSCKPISYYAVSKLAATNLCQVFAQENNKPIVTLRLFSVFGPLEEAQRFIPTIVKNLFLGTPLKLTPGKQRRDFIYIDDVINAYFAAIENKEKIMGEIINIGTGKEYTNDEVVENLFNVVGKKVKIEKGKYPKRMWDTTHWLADITKAKKLLNWEPLLSLDKALELTYAWHQHKK